MDNVVSVECSKIGIALIIPEEKHGQGVSILGVGHVETLFKIVELSMEISTSSILGKLTLALEYS